MTKAISKRRYLTNLAFKELPGFIYRRITAAKRALPNVFILGAPKSGTTSMSHYLSQHPSYVDALEKELMFLQDLPNFKSNFEFFSIVNWLWGHYRQGINAYKKLFPLQSELDVIVEKTGCPAYTGDHTPFYMYCPVAAQRVHSFNPDAKFIILLRNPVNRAYSDYAMQIKRKTGETRTFEQAVQEELDGTCVEYRKNYVNQSVYEPGIRAWLSIFPREQFLIIKSEDFFLNPAPFMKEVFQFLNIEQIDLGEFPIVNQGSYSKWMSPEIKQRLEEYFKPHNEKLYALLDRDFGWS